MKKLIIVAIIFSLVFPFLRFSKVEASGYVPTATFIFEKNSKNFVVDGFSKTLLQETFVENNNLFVPIRNITDEIGAAISWSQKEKSVNITLNDQKVKIVVSSKIALVNGKEVEVLEPKLINGRVFVSIKDLANLFNGSLSSETSLDLPKQITVAYDTTGRKIKVPVKINKIVSLYPMATLLLFPLKMQDALVAIPTAKVINMDNFKKVFDKAGSLKDGSNYLNPNVETILTFKPDLVITSSNTPIDKLNAVGIPTALLALETPQDMLKCIQFLGTILGECNLATDTLVYLNSKLSYIESQTKYLQNKKTVYFALGRLTQTAGSQLMQNDLIKRAGGISVTQNLKGGKVDVNLEQIIAYNPDYIIVAPYSSDSVESILNNPTLSSINAVKNKNVYKMPQFIGSYDLPEPEVILGIMWLSNLLYPDKVNFNLDSVAKEFYKKVFNYNLTNDDLNYIFGKK